MRSWSSVRMPWSIRIWPRWRLACGGTGWFIGDDKRAVHRVAVSSCAQLRRAGLGAGEVEARAARLGERERALVVLERELRLAQVVEAHREVVGEVGVVRLGGEGLEVLLLRLGPAPLLRELVAEREIEHVRARVLGQHRLHAALRGHRVGAPGAQRDERRLRVGVARVGLQQAQVGGLGGLEASGAHVDRGEAEQRVAVRRLLAQRLLVFGARAGEVAGEIGGVAGGDLRMHLRRRRGSTVISVGAGAAARRLEARRLRRARQRPARQSRAWRAARAPAARRLRQRASPAAAAGQAGNRDAAGTGGTQARRRA